MESNEEKQVRSKINVSRMLCSVKIVGHVEADIVNKSIKVQTMYSIAGLIIGTFIVGLAYFLVVHGIAYPDSSWSLRLLGMESQLSDAGPGVILMVVGLFVIYVTRLKIEIHGSQQNPKE